MKGLHLFLILWYFWLIGILEKQWQQQQKNKKKIFDGPSGRMSVCQEGIPLIEGAEHELIRSMSAGFCVFIKQNV